MRRESISCRNCRVENDKIAKEKKIAITMLKFALGATAFSVSMSAGATIYMNTTLFKHILRPHNGCLINGEYHLSNGDVCKPDMYGIKNYSSFDINGKHGKLHGLIFLQDNHETKPTIVHFYGNNWNIATSFEYLSELFKNSGYNVICIDYTNFGCSDKISKLLPSALLDNATDLMNYILDDNFNIDKNKIILDGFSFGCYPAAFVASNEKYKQYIKCVILTAPFTKDIDIMSYRNKRFNKLPNFHKKLIVSSIVDNSFSNEEFAKNIDCPILIVSPSNDRVCPPYMADRLFDICSSTKKFKLIVNNSGHKKVTKDLYKNAYGKIIEFIQCANGLKDIDNYSENQNNNITC